MIQQIVIGLIFCGAIAYLGRLVYRAFKTETACASGCGKCSAVDFKKIEKELQQRGL
ncbi:MAG: FeoB-associated Cys-rich membrane protein [Bacteroidia bacterium]|nr:FeoB-associated Cys-rich membrane protein [Bacteroidia bacterium]